MPDIPRILADVEKLKAMMISVATGRERIDAVETEYVDIRNRLVAQLGQVGIPMPNSFRSLWDWHGYWQSTGLTTYKSRRKYVDELWCPVQQAIEQLQIAGDTSTGEKEEVPIFSQRHGYVPDTGHPEITIREDAPMELRNVVIDVATKALDCDALLTLASGLGKRPWETPAAQSSGTPSRIQLRHLVESWDWYLVYDLIESIHSVLGEQAGEAQQQEDFEARLNQYFEHAGVGWQLIEGKIVTRGAEAFETVVHVALPALGEIGASTAQNELHQALLDLSRRPAPDLTGAIQHAMAALECTARAGCNDSKATLGSLLKRNRDIVPKPLDTMIEKAWGYASEMGRHVREGREPGRDEAELMVGIAAAVATYLARKM